MIKIDVEIGDTILTGKFKNKVTVIKNIGTDEHGMPTINGKKVVTFRIKKKSVGENKMSKKKEKLDEGLVMISSLLPVGQVHGLLPKRKDNFKFKGLPGQFNEQGEKVLDEMGQPIKEAGVIDQRKGKIRSIGPDDYRNMLADVEDMLNELVNIGEDGEIFRSPKSAHKMLKQAYILVNKVK
jgi:hypothetical protein